MLDSVADDVTVAAAITGLAMFKPGFLKHQIIVVIILLGLYLLQAGLALAKYGKLSSFHTYTAKIAAILQGIFLLLFFFLPQPVYVLFYLTVAVTAIDVAEEILIIMILPEWKVNVKGLYWLMKTRQKQ